MKLANIWNGLLINIQFFTIIPIRKEIQMTKSNLTGMILTLPLFGMFLGIIYAFTLAGLIHFTPLSNLAISIVFIVFMTVITGGIHIDGWMDTFDGFFSYQEKQKRLVIMEDPRIGAFGVLGLLLIIVLKFLFIFETISTAQPYLLIYIVAIPFLSRMFTGIGLILINPAKTTGLGYLFHSTNYKVLRYYLIYIIPTIIILGIYNLNYMLVFAFLVGLIGMFFIVFKRFAIRGFGGLTGDLSGAGIEGVELILWFLMWLLHYYVMVGL